MSTARLTYAQSVGRAARAKGARPAQVRSIMARALGIELTPRGEPLFARDLPEWTALGDLDLRTDAEIAEDEADPS